MSSNLVNETDKKYILRFQQELLDLEYDVSVKDVNTLIVEARSRKLELKVATNEDFPDTIDRRRAMVCKDFYPIPRVNQEGRRTFRYTGAAFFDEPADFDEAVELAQEQLNKLYKQGYLCAPGVDQP